MGRLLGDYGQTYRTVGVAQGWTESHKPPELL